MSESIDKTGDMVWWLAFCLFLSYLVTYFAAFKGLKSIGAAVYFTVLAPYVILTIFLIRGVTLEGAGEGLKYLFKPDISKLGDVQVWVDAANQILFSSGVSFGPLMYYGTARRPDEKILRPSYLVPIMNSATSLYAALGMFSFLGHVSHVLNIPVDQVSTSGLDLAFVAYPGMINMLAGSNFWALIFFMMLVTLGIDSVFGFLDHILNYFRDMFPIIKDMPYEVYTAIFCFFSFMCSLIFVLESGLHTFALFDTYACSISLFTCILFELALIPWVFGMDKLNILLKERTGETIPKFVIIFVKFIIPLYITAIYILAWINEFKKDGDEERDIPYSYG
jgi:SNF family Na+-dependent transporter